MVRPAILFSLFADVSTLNGVGKAAVKSLSRLLGVSSASLLSADADVQAVALIRDLLFHCPSSVVDRRRVYDIAQAPKDVVVTLRVRVDKHFPSSPARSRRPYKVTVEDETGSVIVVFFNGKAEYLQRILPEGKDCVISGKLEEYDGVLQMPHPDTIALVEEFDKVAVLEPQYPLTAGINMKNMHKWMQEALKVLPDFPEWLRDDVLVQYAWPSLVDALNTLHAPEEPEDIAIDGKIRHRLAYDELLAYQLALGVMRAQVEKEVGKTVESSSALQKNVQSALPFELTENQQKVLHEIEEDMRSGTRMMRLLQGDVGSGKTVVALLAMLNVVAQGAQAALMAPTELLARQHVASLRNMLAGSEVQVVLLTGKATTSEKKSIQVAIAAGSIDIVVGTHALFQQAVQFKQLDMIVVDEQHRFGVNQRSALSTKGNAPHMLLMTATPIPRTLTMTVYGDMASSLLKEKPQGRLPIDTRAIPLHRIEEVIAGIQRVLERSDRVYWICPLVEEKQSDMLGHDFAGDLAAAEERHRVLKQILGDRVGLVHGQMPVAERESVMQGFAQGKIDVLVATTVVEVGVDVPEATIIVIEHAERFGLAQLHQLRGRVGRSDKQSSCILLYSENISEVATKRLKIIRESNDGFYIAEEDLMLRGAGEVLGTRQSGLPQFYFADLVKHRDMLRVAYDDVRLILQQDPLLQTQRGQALQLLLALYGYDMTLQQKVAA